MELTLGKHGDAAAWVPPYLPTDKLGSLSRGHGGWSRILPGMAAIRRITATLAIGMVVPGTLLAQQAGMTTLQRLRDNARPLLIFASRPDDPQLEIQVRTLTEHAAEAHDRQLVPIAIPYNNPSPTAVQLSPQDSVEARRRFHVAPGDFTVILLGKDGGAKLRATHPLSMQKLNETIDAMPMRQDEIRSK